MNFTSGFDSLNHFNLMKPVRDNFDSISEDVVAV